MAASQKQDLTGETVRVGTNTETLGDKIGGGAEGDVYHLRGSESAVVKLFYESIRPDKEKKIREMVKESNQPRDKLFQEEGVRSIIWPSEAVESNTDSDFLGYKMPEKDLDDVENAHLYALLKLNHEDSSYEQRVQVAYNLAYMVYSIHDQGHAIGDFNDDNIFINEEGYVTLIDCDAFHIKTNTEVYEGQTYFPRYTPPEGRPENLKAVKEADKFCLGVHIFQFLMGGAHPYEATGSDAATGDLKEFIENNPFPYETTATNVSPRKEHERKYHKLPSNIRDLFAKSFRHSGKELGWGRPSPVEWVRTLGSGLGVPDAHLPAPDSTGGNGNTGDWTNTDPFGNTDTATTPTPDTPDSGNDEDWMDNDVYGAESNSDPENGSDEDEDWTEDDVF